MKFKTKCKNCHAQGWVNLDSHNVIFEQIKMLCAKCGSGRVNEE